MSRELRSLLGELKQIIALWHWASNIIAFFTLISEKGITQGAIFWIISGIISGFVAEVLQTFIPSYLRPIFKYFFDWD